MSNKKLQNYKKQIDIIALLFLSPGLIVGIIVVSCLLNGFAEKSDLRLGIIATLFIFEGIGLITFRKWARILGSIFSIIIIIGLLLLLVNDRGRESTVRTLAFMPIYAYTIIILNRKDTKRIFEAKGYIEGLE